MRRLLGSMAVCGLLLVGAGATAQDRTQTLADIRQELSVLFVDIQRLRTELSTTGSALGTTTANNLVSRADAIEEELRRLTARTEEIELRIERIVSDGTNRIGDLEFRLCELEADCDIANLGQTPRLGGDIGAPAAPEAPSAPAGANLAVAEQSDFDRARAALDAGDFAGAAAQFAAFTSTYPGGPLSAEAHFLRGEAEAQQGAWPQAARAYLDSFTSDPAGDRAPFALLNLGTSLGQLGQVDEACLTLGEVDIRYPASDAVAQALSARRALGCS